MFATDVIFLHVHVAKDLPHVSPRARTMSHRESYAGKGFNNYSATLNPNQDVAKKMLFSH